MKEETGEIRNWGTLCSKIEGNRLVIEHIHVHEDGQETARGETSIPLELIEHNVV